MELLEWDIYEVTNQTQPLKKVRFRGRIRKFCLQNKINVLVENAVDEENSVRFAVLHQNHAAQQIREFIERIIPGCKINLIKEKLQNPVMSKMKINLEERYEIN